MHFLVPVSNFGPFVVINPVFISVVFINVSPASMTLSPPYASITTVINVGKIRFHNIVGMFGIRLSNVLVQLNQQ